MAYYTSFQRRITWYHFRIPLSVALFEYLMYAWPTTPHGVCGRVAILYAPYVPWTRQRGAVVPKRVRGTQWVVVSAAVVQRNCGGLMAGPRSDVQPLFNVL